MFSQSFSDSAINSYANMGIFCSFSVRIIIMKETIQYPELPPCLQHRFTGKKHEIFFHSTVQKGQNLQNLDPEGEMLPTIENYYCREKGDFLIKVTVIKFGKQVLKFTDRISIKNQGKTEEDNRTKLSLSNSSEDNNTDQHGESKRIDLSKTCQELIRLFRKWIKANYPGSIGYIKEIRKLQSERLIVDFISENISMRQTFLMFFEWYKTEKFKIRIKKMASEWAKECLASKERERQRQEYVDQFLQQM